MALAAGFHSFGFSACIKRALGLFQGEVGAAFAFVQKVKSAGAAEDSAFTYRVICQLRLPLLSLRFHDLKMCLICRDPKLRLKAGAEMGENGRSRKGFWDPL